MSRSAPHLLLALSAALCANAAWASDYPTRKPGLWEMTTTSDNGTPPSKAQQCIDAAADRVLIESGGAMAQQMCKTLKTTRDGDKFTLEQSCQLGPRQKTTTRTVMSGDYQRAYRSETVAQFDPPIGQMKQLKSVDEVRWLGPCKPGQRPGDVITDGGMKINLVDMMKAMQAKQGQK